jgi:alanine racemase
MDQIVVDVTDIPDVKAGDAAILFGGGAADSVDDVAADGHHQL